MPYDYKSRESYRRGLEILEKRSAATRVAVPEPFQSNVKSLLILFVVLLSDISEYNSEKVLAKSIVEIGEALFAEGYEACLTEHFNTLMQKKTPTKVGE